MDKNDFEAMVNGLGDKLPIKFNTDHVVRGSATAELLSRELLTLINHKVTGMSNPRLYCGQDVLDYMRENELSVDFYGMGDVPIFVGELLSKQIPITLMSESGGIGISLFHLPEWDFLYEHYEKDSDVMRGAMYITDFDDTSNCTEVCFLNLISASYRR